MFSLKCVNKSFVFLFESLFEIMQKALFLQYKTAPDAPAETPPGGSLGHSQGRLFSLGWPLGRLWGPGPLLETISGFRWSHLWSWKLSGALFGCIWAFFGLLFELVGSLWDLIF